RYGGRIRPANWGRFFAALASLLVITLTAGSIYAYVYLPEGSVSVTMLPKPTTVSVEISVSTGAAGQQGSAGKALAPSSSKDVQTAPSLNGQPVRVTLTEEGTRPASGTRQVPRGRAQGTMHFTNRTSNAITVAAG